MNCITFFENIIKLWEVFRVPNILVSNEGRAFTMTESLAFCQKSKRNNIQPTGSLVFHPQSKSYVLLSVDRLKRSLLKLKVDKTVYGCHCDISIELQSNITTNYAEQWFMHRSTDEPKEDMPKH